MSTSRLQKRTGNLLRTYFSDYVVDENIRPKWMIASTGERLELDFYINDLKFAIEVQGKQHYEYVEFFHGSYENYLRQKSLDKEKIELCAKRGCILYEVFTEYDVIKIIENKRKLLGRPIQEISEIHYINYTQKEDKKLYRLLKNTNQGVSHLAGIILRAMKGYEELYIPGTQRCIEFYNEHKIEIYIELYKRIKARRLKDNKYDALFDDMAPIIRRAIDYKYPLEF